MSRFALVNVAALAGVGGGLLLGPEASGYVVTGVVGVWSLFLARGITFLEEQFFCPSLSVLPQRADSGKPAVALTFDDGPDPETTPYLLELLARRGVTVAFFAIGRRVAEHPELARRCREAGHLVENHSQRHAWWNNFLFTRAMTREIETCSAEIHAATGVAPRYYRPPFGLSNHALRAATRRAGLQVVGWQVRGIDSRTSDPERVVARILARVRPGGIVLLHDGGRERERVLAVVEQLLDGLAERGIAVRRLDELQGG